MELIWATNWRLSVLTGGYSFYIAKTIRCVRKGDRFIGLNESLGSRVVCAEQHLRAGIFIWFMVKSLGHAFFFYNFRGRALSIITTNTVAVPC